jgi:hypothetical protein
MRTLLLGLALLVAATSPDAFAKGGAGAAKKSAKASTPAPDPNVAVGKSHGGKVWIVTGSPPSVEGEDLNKWLSSHASVTEVTKKENEDRWPITFIAVFKKSPAKGPVTVEFVDKQDPKTLVDQFSPPTVAESVVFQEPYDHETHNGFNKGHTYVIKVGQIIKKKFVSYASGEITLK